MCNRPQCCLILGTMFASEAEDLVASDTADADGVTVLVPEDAVLLALEVL